MSRLPPFPHRRCAHRVMPPIPQNRVRGHVGLVQCFLSRLMRAALLAGFSAGLSIAAAQADGISVNKVAMHLSEDGYQLSAGYNITLNAVVQEALSRGIPLYFVSEFSLTRSRMDWLDKAQQSLSRRIQSYFVDAPVLTHWSWLDENIFKGEETTRLSYNVLTRRYRISRGALFQNFANLDDALNTLSRQSSSTIPVESMNKEGKYMAAARFRLDITQLPKPLQVNAMTGNEWTLDSAWYRWVINPQEITVRKENAPE